MKRSKVHEVAKGEHTLKRNVIEPIQPCPLCGEKPTFCRSTTSYGYCLNATDGIKKCTFKPKIEPRYSFAYAVETWNNAVWQWHHDQLLRISPKKA